MKSILPLTSVATASLLLLSSCGEKESSAEQSSGTPAATAVESADSYPLKNCVVSGEALGSMGVPVVVKHEGTEVRFCCKDCLPEFNKDPDKFVAMVKAGETGTADHSKHNN